MESDMLLTILKTVASTIQHSLRHTLDISFDLHCIPVIKRRWPLVRDPQLTELQLLGGLVVPQQHGTLQVPLGLLLVQVLEGGEKKKTKQV